MKIVNKLLLTNLVVTSVLVVFVALLMSWIHENYHAEREKGQLYYVVDVEEIYAPKKAELEDLIKNGADQEQINKYRNELVGYLEKTDNYLTKIAEKNHIAIFNKKALYGSKKVVDITPEVINAIK